MPDPAMQDRRCERLPTNLTGTYRTPRGFECEVDVDDLSLGGCRVDDMRGGLQLGEYVQITLGEAGPFTAEVAWRQSSRVGLQFTRTLPPHIVEALTGVDVTAPPPEPEAPAPSNIPRPYIAPEPVESPTPQPAMRSAALPGGRRRLI